MRPAKNWLILVTIRIILNLFSQRSYIHPDEFFQGLEIVAGDLFNCADKIYRPWEFTFGNVTSHGQTVTQQPIRNMALPYFFYGLPLAVLRYVSQLGATRDFSVASTKLHTDLSLITVQTNTLIYYPRFFMTICSVVVDIALFNLADLCDLDNSSVLITFASSYIALVYLTRTFSNSIETILFATLVYLVIKSIKSQYVLNDKFLVESSNSHGGARSVISAANNEFKINKSNDSDHSSLSSSIKRIRLFDIYRYNYLGSLIGFVIAVGVFNRPTFIIYSFVPVVYWTLYGLDNCHTYYQMFGYMARRLVTISKSFVPTAAFFVAFDTAYFYK
jgi:phosphatidylinositol glycan class Z